MNKLLLLALLVPIMISCRYENVTHNTPEYYGGGVIIDGSASPDPTPIPEPATALLLTTGLAFLYKQNRRSK